ncbi:ABC transporter ATP-binding protein [Pseudactinotalea sp. Z1732]|uniref:ABC transporter ATP-binding protein n=1 Tax=Pseudactinotalea sp. Z1732 TaxID=3413026 RepID=UPI003C7A937B
MHPSTTQNAVVADHGTPADHGAALAPRPPAIAVRGLRKSFPGRDGRIHAVDGVDLTIGHGEIVAFLGPNGAGKTSTLDIVLGLVPPDAGSVAVMGLAPREAVLAGKVSALLQTGGLLRDLTVAETVRYVASTFTAPRPVQEVLERAGLNELANRKVSKCSGGEQQRLRFALALLPDPELLILDEPTAGMDVTARREFWDTMRTEARAGRSVVFATHYLEEAENFAERIVMISGGKIVADGPTSEIRERNSGRTLSVDLPEHGAQDVLDDIVALDVITDVRRNGRRAYMRATDTDAAALALLSEVGASGLEIASANLESAFVALTGTAPVEQSETNHEEHR